MQVNNGCMQSIGFRTAWTFSRPCLIQTIRRGCPSSCIYPSLTGVLLFVILFFLFLSLGCCRQPELGIGAASVADCACCSSHLGLFPPSLVTPCNTDTPTTTEHLNSVRNCTTLKARPKPTAAQSITAAQTYPPVGTV